MKVYLVSFPSDIHVIKRIMDKGKKEMLLSYFFIQEDKVNLKDVLNKAKTGGVVNEDKQSGVTECVGEGKTRSGQ